MSHPQDVILPLNFELTVERNSRTLANGVQTIESNSFETIHLRPRHLRPVPLRPHSFESTFIWNHVHLRPQSFETCSFETTVIWDHIHLRPHSFETAFIWDHIHLRPHSFEVTFVWDHIHWDHIHLRPQSFDTTIILGPHSFLEHIHFTSCHSEAVVIYCESHFYDLPSTFLRDLTLSAKTVAFAEITCQTFCSYAVAFLFKRATKFFSCEFFDQCKRTFFLVFHFQLKTKTITEPRKSKPAGTENM